MAGVAQRIVLAAPTGANGHHESIGFHHIAVGGLDAHRPGYQHRAVGYHLHPSAIAHGLSARITTSSSVRQPFRIRPVASSQPARADNTGPNRTRWEATTSASRPVNRK